LRAAVARELPRIALAIEAIVKVLAAGGPSSILGRHQRSIGGARMRECPPTFRSRGSGSRIIAGGETALARASEASEDDPRPERATCWLRVLVGRTGRDRCQRAHSSYVLGGGAGASVGAVTAASVAHRIAGSYRGRSISRWNPRPARNPQRIDAVCGPAPPTKMVHQHDQHRAMIRLAMLREPDGERQPTNHKLKHGALRIIEQAADVPAERARQLLEESGRSVRTAS